MQYIYIYIYTKSIWHSQDVRDEKEAARDRAGEVLMLEHLMVGFQATAEKLFSDGSSCLIRAR